jgi:hypothetical protein
MSWRIMASATVVAVVALSHPAAAQPPTLRGPWFGGGIGTAWARVHCELCTSARNGVTTSGNLTSGTTIVTAASFSMLQLGAGLTWR